MPAFRRPILAALMAATGVLASVAVASCGNSGQNRAHLLSPTSASSLRANLAAVEHLSSQGQCDEATARASSLQQEVGSLSRVDRHLRSALAAGATHLVALVQRECQPVATAPAASPPSPSVQENSKKKENPGKGKGKQKHELKQNPNNGGNQDTGNGVVTGPDQTGGTDTGTVGQPPTGATP